MPESLSKGNVIPITRGYRKTKPGGEASRLPGPPQPARDSVLSELLDGLHPRVRAVLISREGKWQFLERLQENPPSRSVLSDISLPDLLSVLDRSGVRSEEGERMTVSPWPGFDLAILLRDGKPCYAACFDEGTSIYIAEATLPEIARFFDQR